MGTNETSSGAARVTGTITGYRDWAMAQSLAMRVLLAVGMLILLGIVGLAVPTLQATIGVILTMAVSWVALLFALYTWYAVGRSLIGR